eukprot:TRINITY_DN80232_c0_g1_i1.p1 TRINITY_DN80232_c0_g1~~TRINITY_DN80232_c0_g1_i1.p1  ORF type:complete len:338 (+),score=53.27 TRINITY_DN80232_c0_g1_i1:99-1112(+)
MAWPPPPPVSMVPTPWQAQQWQWPASSWNGCGNPSWHAHGSADHGQASSSSSNGSCADFGFCDEQQQRAAYASMLGRLVAEGFFSACVPDDEGLLRINLPFAGKFDERIQLVDCLRKEVLDRRKDVRAIRINISDVIDFHNGRQTLPSGDPQIEIHCAVQDGRSPLPPAHVLFGMHPDCTSSFLTSYGGYYQAYYYMWQEILRVALQSAPLAAFTNLWLEESLEVQKVAREMGLCASPALKNHLYYGQTRTGVLTANPRDRQPCHYLVILQKSPATMLSGIRRHEEDYDGPYQNQWTIWQWQCGFGGNGAGLPAAGYQGMVPHWGSQVSPSHALYAY